LIELETENFVFCGEGKAEEAEVKPVTGKPGNNNKPNPHIYFGTEARNHAFVTD